LENKAISWETLPSSKIYKGYLSGDSHIRALFQHQPFEFSDLPTQIGHHTIDPKIRAELLREYNQMFDLSDEQQKSLDLLALPETTCIVTGQQLSLFGGPLYTFFKISTTILLARHLSKEHSRNIVPVFWLADEDHDFEEIATISLPKGAHLEHISIDDHLGLAPPVSERILPQHIDAIIRQCFEHLGQTDFSDSLKRLISKTYQVGKTYREAFGDLINEVFGKYGLILAGSHHPSIKKALIPKLLQSVEHPTEIEVALRDQSLLVEKITHPQAAISDSILFYLHPEHQNARLRIKRFDTHWRSDPNLEWSDEQLRDEILHHPEHFSPNVFLRPLLQDTLLPTLAYVAGPGEIAYYAQMKQLYAFFGQTMPRIYPRHSATIIEPGIARILSELPFSFQDYQQRIEVLEKEYLSKEAVFQADSFSREWIKHVREQSTPFIDEISGHDASLQASAQKVMAEFEESVDRLTQKVVRSLKQKEQTSLNRISKVKNALFPDDSLQERSIAGVYFMNKYGLDFWDRIIEHFEKIEPTEHHLVEL
jgi:bacillithiol synthase